MNGAIKINQEKDATKRYSKDRPDGNEYSLEKMADILIQHSVQK